jgi:hypothetical protein
MDHTMVARRGGAVLAALASSLLGFPALAQDDCAPVIQSLAETVLEGRETLPPLQARRLGTRAIYLLMRYGELTDDAAGQLLADAIEGRMHGADDLDFAWRVHTHGLEATLAALGPDALTAAVDSARISSLRALVTAGGSEALMQTLAALPEADRFSLGQLILTVTFDLPDAQKAELGVAAAHHDLPWLAAGFAATQVDPAAWSDHLDGMSTEELDQMSSALGWMPTFNGNPQTLLSTAERSAEADATRDVIRLVSWAAALQPEASPLMTYLNQTGETTFSGAAAKSLVKQFQTGKLSLQGPLDEGWLAMSRAFAEAGLDADGFAVALGNVSANLDRAGRETVIEVLDWIVAVDALTPYLEGTTAMPTTPPEGLSSQFTDWDHWLALATSVRAAPEAAAAAMPDEGDLPILAELLLAAGERTLLAQMLETTPVTAQAVTMADDFAARVDRLCAAHLWHKGEAPLLAGRALFKFDAAGE